LAGLVSTGSALGASGIAVQALTTTVLLLLLVWLGYF
jgi:hypothetical protein